MGHETCQNRNNTLRRRRERARDRCEHAWWGSFRGRRVSLAKWANREIRSKAEDIILGQMRAVIATMKIEEINRDRDAFLHRVQQSLEPELKKIGLVLINVNITDITDESGYIDAVIYPEDTRPTLIRSLEMLKNKQDHHPPKKHGNIPL